MIHSCKFYLLAVLIFPIGQSLRTEAQTQSSGTEQTRLLVTADLNAMAQLKFGPTSAAFREMFGESRSGAALVKFVTSRVFHFVYESGPGRTMVARTDMTPGSHLVFIRDEYFRSSTMTRWTTLLHEARHAENSGYPHSLCSAPYSFSLRGTEYKLHGLDKFQNQPACDSTDQGGYAVSYIMLRAIAESCLNCDPQLKSEVELQTNFDGLVRINNVAAADRLFQKANLHPNEYFQNIVRPHLELMTW